MMNLSPLTNAILGSTPFGWLGVAFFKLHHQCNRTRIELTMPTLRPASVKALVFASHNG
jgi:hypothetical protein